MGIFRQFPYSNFHDMNMDEIIKIMREMQDEWAATSTQWASYKEFIDNYFANLNLDDETEKALRKLVNDGTLSPIIDPVIISEVATWLNEHITPTTPAIDDTLSISGAAADAKVTGDKITDLQTDITLLGNNYLPVAGLVDKSYVDLNGQIITEYNNWSRTDYLPVAQYSQIIAKTGLFASKYNCFYDIDKNFISSFNVPLTEANIHVPSNAAYVIFSNQTAAMAHLIAKVIPKTDAGVVKLNKQINDTPVTTSNGLTYSVNNDILTVEGVSTGPFNLNIEGAVNEIPRWLEADTTYYVDIKKQGRGTIYFEIDLYDADMHFIRSACKLENSGSFNMGSLSGVAGAIIRWYIRTGTNIKAVVSNGIYSRPSANYLTTEMKNAGIIPLNNPAANIESATSNNVTYSKTNDIVSANGKASSAVDIRMEGSVDSFPDWVKENTDYIVKIQKSGTGRIVFEVDLYNAAGTFVRSAWATEASGRFSIGSLADIYGAIVRYYVPTGSTLDNVVIKSEVYISNSSSGSDAEDDTGANIRVMQYNIGRYRWGYLDISQWGLTEAQYIEKLANYKKFFGKYKPDILGLQEYVVTMDKAETHNAYDNLFGALFNVASASRTDTHQTRIFGCCDADLLHFQGFTGDDRTVSWTVGEAYINGKTVAIATGPLSPYDSSGDYYEARRGQINAVIDALAGYDYAILMFDSNLKTAAELAEFKQIATSAGYTIGNGDYWGAIDTYVSHPGVTYPFVAIDTIWVKGNIKIRNFEALTDEYDALSSDHIPVIADLYIY